MSKETELANVAADLAALLERIQEIRALKYYTVAVCQSDGMGTHYVTGGLFSDIEEARQAALKECAKDWGDWDIDALDILFVAEGKVTFLEYQDFID